MKRKRKNRLLSLGLSLCLTAGLAPLSGAAYGAEAPLVIAFAGHEWWVAGGMDVEGGVDAPDNAVTLLSKDIFETTAFREHSETEQEGFRKAGDSRYYYAENSAGMAPWTTPNEYAGSALQQKMTEIAAGLPQEELDLLLPRTIAGGGVWPTASADGIAGPEVGGQTLWPLSLDEWRQITDPGVQTLDTMCWLRTPASTYSSNAFRAPTDSDDSSAYPTPIYYTYAARPACFLDLTPLLFVSPADNSGHRDFGAAEGYGDGAFKCTMGDENSFEAAALDKTTVAAGGTVTVSHPALSSFGAGYTNVTVELQDRLLNRLCYGSVNGDPDATESTVSIPADLAPGSEYVLRVYAEDWNEANHTDFATGTPFQTTLTVTEASADQDGDGYHDGDAAVVEKIMDANQLSGYSKDDPAGWRFAVWNEEDARRITALNIGGMGLTGVLDVSGLEALTRLDCAGNELTELDLSQNLLLTDLNCADNPFASFTNPAGHTLTVRTSGNGTVRMTGYDSASAAVTLTAYAGADAAFARWTVDGGLYLTENPPQLPVLGGDLSVEALFLPRSTSADTLLVSFDTDNGGGSARDDNELKTALEAALAVPGVDKTQITTIQLVGDAASITGWNWRYLINQFYQYNNPFENLTTLDLSRMPRLKTIDNGNYAYLAYLTKLRNVLLPDGLEELGTSAFYYCQNLEEIQLPAGLKTIGDQAFYHCDSLKAVDLPEDLEALGYNAFLYCQSLAALRADQKNRYYTDVDGVLYNAAQTTLIKFPQAKNNLSAFVLPETVTEIADNACFANKALTSAVLPAGIQSIGEGAFFSCDNLESVNLPDTLRSIGNNAFNYCRRLASVVLPETLETIGRYAFSGCDALTEINIPSNQTAIAGYAFMGCKNLTGVRLPEGIAGVGEWAFSDCENLVRVDFPTTLTAIDLGAFRNCAKLAELVFRGTDAPRLGNYVFDGVPESGVIYHPTAGTDAYAQGTFGGTALANWTRSTDNPDDKNGDGYHDGDVAAVNAILARTPLPGFSPDDPGGWTFAAWNGDGIKRITALNLGGMGLTGVLNLSPLEALTQLDCRDNALTTLNVAHLRNLTTLDCGQTSFSTIVWVNGKTLTAEAADGGAVYLTACSPADNTVTLTAEADPGFVFLGWTAPGWVAAGSDTAALTLDRDTRLLAAFGIPLSVPFVKTVHQNGGTAAPAKTFTLTPAPILWEGISREEAEALKAAFAAEVTVLENTAATHGAGDYAGVLRLAATADAFGRYLSDGFLVTEAKDGAADWTYDDTVWRVTPQRNDDGVYDTVRLDNGTTEADAMTFTNSYGKSPGGGGGGNVTRHYIITAEAGAGGTVTPGGKISVSQGADQTFAITPKEGYRIEDVVVDGKSVGAVARYTFENVKSSHTIAAAFRAAGGTALPADTGVAEVLNTNDHMVYLYGYPGGAFGPNSPMTRAEAAQMFYHLLRNKDAAGPAGFDDVPADAWYRAAVDTLAAMGVLQGVSPRRFAPERPITRAEFTALAMGFAKLDTGGENIFSDVSAADWYYTPVIGSIQYGWISGYPDGTFRPDDTITRAEVAAVVNRMLGRSADEAYVDAHAAELRRFPDVSTAHWAYYDVAEAANAHDYTLPAGKETWE